MSNNQNSKKGSKKVPARREKKNEKMNQGIPTQRQN